MVVDLIVCGIDFELVECIFFGDEEEYNEECEVCFEVDDEWLIQVMIIDLFMCWVWVYECYLCIDMDVIGVFELWQVLVVVCGWMILEKDWFDEQLVVLVILILVLYKFFGLFYVDIILDVQWIKLVLLCGWLNNIYYLNNGWYVLYFDVNLDDYLVKCLGVGVCFKKIIQIKLSEVVFLLIMVFLGDQIVLGLEYMDKVCCDCIGVDFDQQGLDVDYLKNKGDQGLGMFMFQLCKCLVMVVWIFVEIGVFEFFNKMLCLVVKN